MKTFSMPVSGTNSGTEIRPCAFCGAAESGTAESSTADSSTAVFKPALLCEGFSFVRCKCGLVQRNPQPDKAEIVLRYSSLYGNDYLTYELENEIPYLKLQQLALKDVNFFCLEKKLLKAAENAAPPSFLDIGCATGMLLEYLHGRGWNVTGVEISPCAEYAKRERNLNIYNTPLEDIGFSADNFDVVHASHLIEHLNEPAFFLKEVYRILKPDGNLFIITPNISGFQARLYGNNWRSAIFDHLYLFSKSLLIKMLKVNGFKVISCRTWGGIAAGLAPSPVKRAVDFSAKLFGCGDVMIIRARK
ncbi:MAG: class I SAM-dependent methyltransferase [Treponema sp.]|nr:class I SAM-dependent methyltransferase [Treponema sp.]